MRKDPQVLVIHERLEIALDSVESYIGELESEARENETAGGDPRLTRLLCSQIDFARRLQDQLTGGVWDSVLDLVNRSVPLNQARNGGFV